ncbi:hypothetical protein EDD86DRAFT_214679 [Gorgonomyces haynaldii]|nr:hypothetical protein EDD86DRAFT_214679 [Gorgonomyces haynaldii]
MLRKGQLLENLVRTEWIYAPITLIGGPNDGGVDLRSRLTVDDKTLDFLFQCKNYSKPVGPSVIRELEGVLSHSTTSVGVICTTHGLSREARRHLTHSSFPFISLQLQPHGSHLWLLNRCFQHHYRDFAIISHHLSYKGKPLSRHTT